MSTVGTVDTVGSSGLLRGCWNCQWAGLPRRQVCPRCAGSHWLDLHSTSGTVTASTSVWRNLGITLANGESLLTVLLDCGGSVIAASAQGTDMSVGSRVWVNSSLRATCT